MKDFKKRGVKINISQDMFNKNTINVFYELVPMSDKNASTTEVAAKAIADKILLLMEKLHVEKQSHGYINIVELKRRQWL